MPQIFLEITTKSFSISKLFTNEPLDPYLTLNPSLTYHFMHQTIFDRPETLPRQRPMELNHCSPWNHIKRYIASKSNGPWNSTIAAHQLLPADIFKHFFIPHSTICEYYVNILDKLVQHFTWNWYPRIIAYPGCSPLDTCFNIFLKLIQQSMNTDSTFQYIDLTFMGL